MDDGWGLFACFVGGVERTELIDGSRIRAGDVLIGLASSGPHSNGYSLIRKVLELTADSEIDGLPAAQRLLVPTRIYVRPVLELARRITINGLAHITGGGISDNVPRVLGPDVDAELDTSAWQPGPVFDWLAEHGNIETAEMRRTFNCGIGMIVVVHEADAGAALDALASLGEDAFVCGRIVPGGGEVRFL